MDKCANMLRKIKKKNSPSVRIKEAGLSVLEWRLKNLFFALQMLDGRYLPVEYV